MPIERFERWYGTPVKKLAELPNGDGAFAAWMIGMPLYERYIVGKLILSGREASEENKKTEISSDLQITSQQRPIFWAIFRNGFMHQAMGMHGGTKWAVSSAFGALPVFREMSGVQYICIDPWKFTDRVLDFFRADHRLITASESFPLASIFETPQGLMS